MKYTYTYDDVLIQPNYSEVTPNQVILDQKFTKGLQISLPVISAGMDTVTSYEMAYELAKVGTFGIIHKNQSMDEILNIIKKLRQKFPSAPICASVGTSTAHENIKKIIDNGANILVVDSAHGHSKNVGDCVSFISNNFPQIYIIAGNVTTCEGASYLISKGADAIKVGIGPGAICTTRVVTGVGQGQISAVMEVAKICKMYDKQLIADGGIKYSGDVVKALVAGADMVVMGSMFAGTDQAPGIIKEINGEKYKIYRGMGSLEAMKNGSKDRYNQTDVSNIKMIPEGIVGYVKYKGDVNNVLNLIEGAIRNGMGYVGAKTISQLNSRGKFNLITQAGVKKSHPHSLDKIIPTTNYQGD